MQFNKKIEYNKNNKLVKIMKYKYNHYKIKINKLKTIYT